MTVRVLVADDEPIGRHRLVRLLQAEPGTDVVAACADGDEAVEAIREHAPDIVLLDIQMPHLDGFEVVAALGDAQQPVVIFVTAHDQYALRAFEVHAFDYLLKPVDQDRLREAIARAVSSAGRAQPSPTRRILGLLEELNARERARGRERLVVRTPERAFFLRTETIDYIEAAGKFVHLHVGRTVHALRESMAELEQELDPARFLRISRSVIVNLDRIQEIQPWFQGDYVLILSDGTKLTSTRGYRDNMRRLLGRSA
ncbi:MAG TPA: LytTR family DNA-binding domain-containing protein [Gemmatimonadales bacterium]|jgi:two-component system LytT family response regulator|nr:LytTR family DNA-binding domain-containing protein [Gemmatimonadales bacterium]